METNQSVGSKIRSIRESKNLSIAEVAERASLTVEQIAFLEGNSSVPALAPLLKVARAMGVRLGTFLDDQVETGAAVRRATQTQMRESFSTTSNKGLKKEMNYFSLSNNKSNRHMEPFMIDINPADTTEYELSSHEGEEFIYILSGEIEVFYGKEIHRLGVGDTIYYDSIVPHNLHAYNNMAAKILAVIYTPI